MLIWSAIVVASLMILNHIQGVLFSNSRFVKNSIFKWIQFALIIISSFFMLYLAYMEKKTQERYEAVLTGISKTVFIEDLTFDISGTYNRNDSNIRATPTELFIRVYIIPRTSKLFCAIGITHTPTLELGGGAMFFEAPVEPPENDLFSLMVQEGSQFLIFSRIIKPQGGEDDFQMRLKVSTVIPQDRYLSIDEHYEESLFFAVFNDSGILRDIHSSALVVKGKNVPLNFVREGNRWLASTMYRRTWELRCEN